MAKKYAVKNNSTIMAKKAHHKYLTPCATLYTGKSYDPYDVGEYDNSDDFADEWAEEFGDGNYDERYDDAYDYWEDEME